uniref:Uncharacterized protein n=1 Tax=Glossina austeni TaxID=7395 RepID=A0A1A9VIP0_GLOAU
MNWQICEYMRDHTASYRQIIGHRVKDAVAAVVVVVVVVAVVDDGDDGDDDDDNHDDYDDFATAFVMAVSMTLNYRLRNILMIFALPMPVCESACVGVYASKCVKTFPSLASAVNAVKCSSLLRISIKAHKGMKWRSE